MNLLLPRLLTIVVGLPFLVTAIYLGGLPLFFLILAIILLGLREYYFLAEECGYPCFNWIGIIFGFLITASIFLNGLSMGQITDNQATAALTAVALIVLVVRSLFRGPGETLLSEWGVTLFGVFYVAWSLAHLLLIRDLRPQGLELSFLLFVIIWVEDITAYLVGSKWGRHAIAPGISPKKSWEGTIAGIIGAMIAAALFQITLLRQTWRLPEILVVAAVVSILAFVSDLGESLLKRSAGVKDSSPLLPGHGGILDRFDSFILAAPFFYYYCSFIKH
jgi:phosphatidate cytidylyltransferase